MTTSLLPLEARETFLAHYPPPKRGTIANWFLAPIRERKTDDPQVVVACVLSELYRRLENAWASEEALTDASAAVEIIQEHRDEALAFAQYYIEYEALPEAEREALKQAQREEGRNAWMAAQPPTVKQLSYLRSMGYAGVQPTSMLEASEHIDRLLAARGRLVRR